MEIITTGFDYQTLEVETRIVIQQRAGEIKTLVKRSVSDVVDVGNKLAEVRELLGHNRAGGFKGWLKAEFGWSYETALNFIRVSDWASHYNGNFTTLDIAPSALYLLANPSTPESIRQEVIGQAEDGERITYKKAKTKTGGIPKKTVQPQTAIGGIKITVTPEVADTEQRQPRKPSIDTSDSNQVVEYDDFSQYDPDDTGPVAGKYPPNVQQARGLLEQLGWSCIPPEAADEPSCPYCARAYK